MAGLVIRKSKVAQYYCVARIMKKLLHGLLIDACQGTHLGYSMLFN